ncbi:MAG: glutamate-1-semialdehyde 2,1-aminomutase [Bacteroidia bacterium]
MNFQKSQALFSRAEKHLVGGVNSPVRAFRSVGGNPLIIRRGSGAWIEDADGNRYIDLVGSYGPLILGHSHPTITSALNEALNNGTSFGATTEIEIKLAELVKEAFPGMDKVRFVNSGTEAVMSAIRLARGFTGRNKVIKFAGCYHGHSDFLLAQSGSGLMTFGMPTSAGVPEGTVKDTLIAKFNDIESVEAIFREHGKAVAAVVTEPVAGNMGVVVPENDFLKKVQELSHRYGALLVVDEVMSGFRKNFGGAQAEFGVEADITCLGKIIGGGLPVGAFGARAEIMDKLAPLGGVYQAGTLSGNPLAMTAGYYTLKYLQEHPQGYQHLMQMTERLETGIKKAVADAGAPVTVNRFGSMINPFFTSHHVKDFDSASTSDTAAFARFFWGLIQNGVYIPPSQFEAWFVPMIIQEDELDKIIAAVRIALND